MNSGQGAVTAGRTALARGIVRIARPKQWIKNLLVFAAPGAAGMLTHGATLGRAIGVFAVFCAAASGTYFLNDVMDVRADRLHPVKRFRPVAAGVVSIPLALACGIALLLAAVIAGWLGLGPKTAAVIAIYVAISTAYSMRLKHLPVIDLAGVSSGFILRAIAGGVACQVPLSNWFLIVASFGSLLIVAGKRSAEHLDLGDDRAKVRRTLGVYPPVFLRSVRLLAAGITLTAYCLWAFERSATLSRGHHPIWFELSIAPFVLVILHLELRFETGHGAAPEDLALGDQTLQILGVLWVLLLGIGIYL